LSVRVGSERNPFPLCCKVARAVIVQCKRCMHVNAYAGWNMHMRRECATGEAIQNSCVCLVSASLFSRFSFDGLSPVLWQANANQWESLDFTLAVIVGLRLRHA
jgi:hypothetical protein